MIAEAKLPFIRYVDDDGSSWAFGTPEFAANLPDETDEEWFDRMVFAADWLDVDSFSPYGVY